MFVLNKHIGGGDVVDVYPDVYDEICRLLAEGEPFAFSRFGDAEFAAMIEAAAARDGGEGTRFPRLEEVLPGRDGRLRSMDGHEFFPDLGERLHAIVASEPDYLMGMGLAARLLFGDLWIRECVPELSRIDWVSANCLVVALAASGLGKLFEGLRGRQVTLVGPPHMERLATRQEWAHVEVPPRNCWLSYPEVRERLEGAADGQDGVFLFCATMMSNVLIDELHGLNPAHTYLDMGSALDPYAGVNSRKFHKALRLEDPPPPRRSGRAGSHPGG